MYSKRKKEKVKKLEINESFNPDKTKLAVSILNNIIISSSIVDSYFKDKNGELIDLEQLDKLNFSNEDIISIIAGLKLIRDMSTNIIDNLYDSLFKIKSDTYDVNEDKEGNKIYSKNKNLYLIK